MTQSDMYKRTQPDEVNADLDAHQDAYISDEGELILGRKSKNDDYRYSSQRLRLESADGLPLSDTSERTMAALGHIAPVLSILSGGLLFLFTFLVPLWLKTAYKDRSEYITMHAEEAVKWQLFTILGSLALILGFPLLGGILAAFFAVTLIGIPIAILLGILIIISMILGVMLPIISLIFSGIAAWKAYNGELYSYPYPKQALQLLKAPNMPWNRGERAIFR